MALPYMAAGCLHLNIPYLAGCHYPHRPVTPGHLPKIEKDSELLPEA
jgi:hypothetical protein